ncbi:aerobic respiration control sensor protein arcB [Microthyrium microscopicum]|uniref:Aerobic respiration control sensor protein arcB n=1 Tax=Microthyrium microscopicum TaxID=703497 RepID=A0A6A6TYC0_9PEZI|nr:aerobic respiration control sensor protein arcB [Microthyrium microscopicum]
MDTPITSLGELEHLSIEEVLDQDSRPSFILDLDPDQDRVSHLLSPIFCNLALRVHYQLYDAVTSGELPTPLSRSEKPSYQDFRAWAISVTTHDDSKDVFPLSFLFGNLLWTGFTVRRRWRIISGNILWNEKGPLANVSSNATSEIPKGISGATRASAKIDLIGSTSRKAIKISTDDRPNLVPVQKIPSSKPYYFPKSARTSSDDTGNSSHSRGSLTLAAPDKACADWTAKSPKGVISDHIALARLVNWKDTPLGPMEKWSPEFRQVANLLMSNPHPAALFWGSDLTMLYNAAYADEVAGNKHPELMGTGFSGPFSELWDSIAPVFAECAKTGVSIRRENDYLPIKRRGFLEETFFSWSWTPLYGGTSQILGFYNAPFDVSDQVRNRRGMETVSKLGGTVSRATSVKQFWKLVLEGLEESNFDVPMALLYSVSDTEDPDHESISSGSTISLKSCNFEGSIGIPEGHPATPLQLDLKRSREGFVPAFREAMRTREPTLLHIKDGSLPEELLEGIEWRGFPDPCQDAIIFPVRPTNGETVLAFLVIGMNPRRPYDETYKSFISLLNRQLATSLASTILHEEEIRRSTAAAIEKESLSKQLALQTDRLRRMTALSPLGMFFLNPEGKFVEANDRFFEMTGLARDEMLTASWADCIMDSSNEKMDEGWLQMLHEHKSWSSELQLKKTRDAATNFDLDGEIIDSWVLFTTQLEFGSGDSLKSILGSITDISHLKWVEGLQSRRLCEAEERRRQQTEFIDITSHEMRNPLSAILQCADDISASLSSYRSTDAALNASIVESCLDSASTIKLCVNHQKMIVDDILTTSKLDSNLLELTPSATQPTEIASLVVRMFQSELQAKKIQVSLDLDSSLQQLSVGWVMLDPSRVLQILINLMTNAIKFTAGSKKKVITVFVAASSESPATISKPKLQYIPVRATKADTPIGDDWGSGDIVFLRFKVKDTGVGLTSDEKQVLFERFKQASPRTHAQYGGSGLGLFISRQLAELHGGQIGVASESGIGSTFGFFISTRRASRPPSFPDDVDAAKSSYDPVSIQSASETKSVNPLAVEPAPILDVASLHILVVEDNQINQKVLVKQLRKFGCTVHAANDGLEALEFLEKTVYRVPNGVELSVVLMDLEMPNMGGLDCVREIRKMEDAGELSEHVPVIAVTANVRDEQIAVAKDAGMDDVVGKPFQIKEIIAKFGVVLRA